MAFRSGRPQNRAEDLSMRKGTLRLINQKDLGPNTAAIAHGIKLFSPDGSWKKV